MAKEVMDRKASDNEYLHKDFHISMNVGLEFVRENYGRDGVVEYLKTFSSHYYAPLTQGLKEQGLSVLRDYFQKIYEIEKADCKIEYSEDLMTVAIHECPALKHFKKMKVTPSSLYILTTLTVYETICEGTPFAFECLEYNCATGKSVLKFFRRDLL